MKLEFKGIPKNEQVWVSLRPQDGSVWYITSKVDDRSTYYLYKETDGKSEKVAKSRNPMDLEDRVWN